MRLIVHPSDTPSFFPSSTLSIELVLSHALKPVALPAAAEVTVVVVVVATAVEAGTA